MKVSTVLLHEVLKSFSANGSDIEPFFFELYHVTYWNACYAIHAFIMKNNIFQLGLSIA